MPLQLGHGQHRQGRPGGLGCGDLQGVAQAEALGEVVVDVPSEAGQGDPQHALPLAAAQRTRRREHQGSGERQGVRRPAVTAEVLLTHPHSNQHREHRLQVEQQRRGPRGEQR